jgi:hypothetical protein
MGRRSLLGMTAAGLAGSFHLSSQISIISKTASLPSFRNDT